MNQENIGKFIAALRKEKKLTQEQLAEKLGVNHRSVSRWENGRCMPDLSILENLSEELGIGVSELLKGKRKDCSGQDESKEGIDLILKLSEQEKRKKATKIRTVFGLGGGFFIAAILLQQLNFFSSAIKDNGNIYLTWLFSCLGLFFYALGFYYNRAGKKLTSDEVEVMLEKTEKLRMKTAVQMLQFVKKYTEADQGQYAKAFREIEHELQEQEAAVFSAVGTQYFRNNLPMMWYVALAVTNKRIIIAGERAKGMLMVSYVTESIKLEDICSITVINGITSGLMLKTMGDELLIEEELSVAEQIKEQILGRI